MFLMFVMFFFLRLLRELKWMILYFIFNHFNNSFHDRNPFFDINEFIDCSLLKVGHLLSNLLYFLRIKYDRSLYKSERSCVKVFLFILRTLYNKRLITFRKTIIAWMLKLLVFWGTSVKSIWLSFRKLRNVFLKNISFRGRLQA